MSGLLSPTTRLPLRSDGAHSLTDGRERWPVLDGIPFLRTGRDALVAAVLADLDRGDPEGALVRLLADPDDWWDGPSPATGDLQALVRGRDSLSLRGAMTRLAFGRVGDYFAHRWSDPTYLAGLALLDAHWREPASAFELACGIGHYLRELACRGVAAGGGDVVFAKLWLARHWVVGPHVELVCFDARSPWPVAGHRVDLCLCLDAFYFLEPKAEIAAALRDLLAPGGILAVGHVHNREADNPSAGAGLTATEIAALFPTATLYDDAELTRAAAEGRAPVPQHPRLLGGVEAFALAEGDAGAPRQAAAPLCGPLAAEALRRNPLYAASGEHELAIVWPSERYRGEYAPRATYRLRLPNDDAPTPDAVRRREWLDLPERW